MGDCGEVVQLLRLARQFHNLGAAAARVDARNVFQPKPKYVPAREMNFNRFDLFSSRRGPLTPAGHRQGRGKRVHCCLIMMIEWNPLLEYSGRRYFFFFFWGWVFGGRMLSGTEAALRHWRVLCLLWCNEYCRSFYRTQCLERLPWRYLL